MEKIKNLEKAAKRILRAIKAKEPIIIYGDSDMDGVSSVVILKEAITSAGGKGVSVYFPDREDDGYGLNDGSLNYLKSKAPALFITLDCGIGNFKEVELAKSFGFEVIIVDHHEILDKLPEASIIVDPKQKGDKYPFKGFAAVGLAFKLAEEIFKGKMAEVLRKSFLQLVAMATIADMMPRTDENENLIMEGIGYIEDSWRPGIQALFGLTEFKDLSLMEKITRVNSLTNIRNNKDGLPAAFRILTEPDIKKAKKLAQYLLEKGKEKKIITKKVIEEIERRLSGQEEVVFEGDKNWELILLGVAAAVVSKNHKKPVFLYRIYEKESQGSVRAPDGLNTVEAMKSCSSLLSTYGGHARASGFRVKNENLAEFKECLIKYFKNNL